MNDDRLAVIDLGSNTFHLLIVEKDNSNPPFFKILFRKRTFTYVLGPNHSDFGNEEIQRAVSCLNLFKNKIDQLKVGKIITVATAAFRLAQNSLPFLNTLESILNSKINILTGHEEAEYIFEGTQLIATKLPDNNLVMDIGGGSVEFISFNKKGIHKMISANCGISYLRHNYHLSEPVTSYEKRVLFDSISESLSVFIDKVNVLKPKFLIGTSGPFEIIEKLEKRNPSMNGNIFTKQKIESISHIITSKNSKERLQIPNMPADRSELSKESFLLIEFALQVFPTIQNLMVSPFGIKEGIISNWLNLE